MAGGGGVSCLMSAQANARPIKEAILNHNDVGAFVSLTIRFSGRAGIGTAVFYVPATR